MNETERLIEDELYRSAAELIKQRFPSGWGGAAAMRLECRDDTPARIVTSVAIETPNASASLCIETGAMCEAMKRNQRITHTICLVRDNENSPLIVLSPCGICQERLRYWGNRRPMRHYRSYRRWTHPVRSAGRPATASLNTGIPDFRARALRLLIRTVGISPIWRTGDAKTMAHVLCAYLRIRLRPLLRHDDGIGIWDNPQSAFA